MTERRKLSDILQGSDRDKIAKAFASAKAAADFGPLPAGEYLADITDGAFATAKTGTPSYKLSFRVTEGDYAGRLFWHDVYLTEAALPMAKRDLGKLGVTSLDQLDRPLPAVFRCKARLSLRRDDNAGESNKVLRFEVIEIVKPEVDAFAPGDPPKEADGGARSGELFPSTNGTPAAAGPYPEGR
jgi:hypothetical protein